MIPNRLPYRQMRIFVASPKDVDTERARLHTVIEEFNRTGGIAEFLRLKLEILDWHTHVGPLAGRPEGVLLEQLPVSMWDVFIGIMWLRFGSSSGGVNPDTGKPFKSGTQEEFLLAYDTWKKTGSPQILFYRCTRAPASLDDIDPDQLKRVSAFFEQFNADSKHPGLYQPFLTAEEFERRVRQDLTRLLLEYSKDVLNMEPPQSIIEFSSSKIVDTLPRREPFFGRKSEISQAIRALDPQDRGWGLVIDGIGGIGKTALAVEVAYICKERGSFDVCIFVTAKRERLDTDGILGTRFAAKTLDEFISETAHGLGQTGILALTGESKQRALLDALSGKRALLIFDNLETLTEVEQREIGNFLRNLPQDCKAIITSRHRVGESAVTLRLGRLEWEDARDLIRDSVARHGSELHALARAEETAWRQLYEEAGGSPLAILWAIGLIRKRGLSFSHALELLHDGSASNDLNAFIYLEAWKRMDKDERTALRSLSLFEGTATREALVATSNLGQLILETSLPRLRALSLVDIYESPDKHGSFKTLYTMHPLTRRFVRQDLANEPDVDYELGMRFAQYWLDYANRYVGIGTEFGNTSNQIASEWKNLFAAAVWLYRAAFKDDLLKNKDAARMLAYLSKYLRPRGEIGENLDEQMQLNIWAYEAASALQQRNDMGWFAYFVAWMKLRHSGIADVEIWVDKCSRAWELGGSRREGAFATRIRGLLAERRGDFDQAFRLLNEAHATWLALGLEADRVIALSDLAGLAERRENSKGAKEFWLEVLKVADKLKDRTKQVICYGNLGRLANSSEQRAEASRWLELGINLARELGLIEIIGGIEIERGKLWKALGRTDLALESAKSARTIYERLNYGALAEVQNLVSALENELSQPRLEQRL